MHGAVFDFAGLIFLIARPVNGGTQLSYIKPDECNSVLLKRK